jgi:hypothetical protein
VLPTVTDAPSGTAVWVVAASEPAGARAGPRSTYRLSQATLSLSPSNCPAVLQGRRLQRQPSGSLSTPTATGDHVIALERRLYGAPVWEGAAWSVRQWLGDSPCWRLNARLNASSES